MTRRVTVTAPSRLHFGLFAFGDETAVRKYGGVGAMIDTPALQLVFEPAEQFSATGPHAARAAAFARTAAKSFGWQALPECRLEIAAAPGEHAGLGLGTQLGLSVAAGLIAFAGEKAKPIEQLAAAVERGRRSAVGAHGFQQGGLIVDDGKGSGDSLGRLAERIALPETWRFVLITPKQQQGLAGPNELEAFAKLPPVPLETSARLRQLATAGLATSARAGDFETFSETLYEYGKTAGECFASVQGGPFASPAIAEVVEKLRSAGVAGCGQSSWGPTVYALCADENKAQILAGIHRKILPDEYDVTYRAPANHGATFEF